MPYNKLFINLACSVCTEEYRTSVFLNKPRPTGLVRYFFVQTSRLVNKKLLFFVFYQLYIGQNRRKMG
jgi:hypothetical protein